MDTTTIARSFGLGAMCGLRSMSGAAVTRWRSGDQLRLLYAALALGELIADKLPVTPARTIPPALAFRMISGGIAARSLASDGGNVPAAMLAGALGAVAGTFGGMRLRAVIVDATKLPDFVVALAEDTLAYGGALAVTRR